MQEIAESIKIDAPAEYCYQEWQQFHQFPNFMKNIEAVEPRYANNLPVWHWVARGPLNKKVSWDAKWDVDRENRMITWHTLQDESDVDMKGSIGFSPLSDDQTQVTVCIKIHNTGGIIGNIFQEFLTNPSQKLREDLNHFKQYLEKQKSSSQAHVSI